MNKPLPRRVLTRSIASMLAFSALVPAAFGADGTFTNVAGGAWNVNTNWAASTIADGAGFTANFNTLDITADRTVTLGAARTIGNLIFGDTTPGTAGSWTIGNATGQTFALTLAGTAPTITVNPLGTGKLAVINVAVAGTAGLIKEGTGILRLSQANTLTGPLTVSNGTLQLGNNGAITNVSAAITVNGNTAVNPAGTNSGNVVFQINDGITAGSGKTVTLNANTATSRVALIGGSGSSWQGNVVLAGNHLNTLQASSTGGTFTVSGNVTGGAGAAFALRGGGLGNMTGNINIGSPLTKTDTGTWTISSTGNTWLTSTGIQDGQITLGVSDALPNLNLVLGQGSGTNGRFDLNGYDQTVTSLSTFGASTGTNHIIRNSNLAIPSTLTFTTAASTTDILKNTHIQGTGALTLTKNGTGRFEVQDVRMENSAFNVNDGTLAFTGTSERHVLTNITGLAVATVERSGAGRTNLNGTFNHAGSTVISGGQLSFSAGNAASITVADGAILGAGAKGGSFTAGTVTFDGSARFAPLLGQTTAPALLNVTNLNTSAAGTPVTPEGAGIAVGTYKLLQYGVGSVPNLTLGAPGTYPHMTAALVNDPVARTVNLNVTAVDSLIWSGATNGTWDVNTTSNFKLASSPTTDAPFFQGDAVLFNDAGLNTAITTAGAVRIGNLTFDNSFGVDYTITGSLAGPGGITKRNTGTVTLASANTFTGPISVSDGMLVLGGANVDHGPVTVTGGTLKLGNTNAISGGALVKISGGGTLDVAGLAPGVRIPELRISGSGVNESGAVINSGAGITNNNHASVIILEGDTTWGGVGRYDINGLRFDGGNFTFTKTGTNEAWWSPTAGSTLGPVVVKGGTFGIQGTNGINTADPITAEFSGTVGVFGALVVTRPIVLESGALQSTGTATGANPPRIDSMVTLKVADSGELPAQRIGASGANVLHIAGQLTGPGGFEKYNTGTVQIQSATHNYLGNTLVSAGTLSFNANGALPATTDLIVNGGTFDPSNLTHTFASVSGAGGIIGQATLGTSRLVTTQNGDTAFNGQLNRAAIAMNGTGVLTLGGTLDNSSGIVEVNSGTVVLGKGNITPVGYAVHSLGTGLTINSGGTAKLDGLYDPAVAVTGINVAPAGTDPLTYVDQIFNAVTINVNAGGTFDLNGRQEAIDGLTQTTPAGGVITNTSATSLAKLFIGHQNASSTFSGVIRNGSSPVAIEKIGTGTLSLEGANTYTGATTLTAGNLVVKGSLGNTAVTVASGSTLSGDGTIAGSVALNGTLLSTNSIGSLTANNGSTISIGGAASAASTASTLNTNSFTLAAGGTRTLNVDFDGTALDRINSSASNGLTSDGTNNVSIFFPNGGGWKTGTYPLFGYAGTVQGAGPSALTMTTPTGHNTVTFVDNGAGQVIQMQVVQNDAVWAGTVNGVWDVNSTANWNIATPPANVFLNGDNAVFNDTGTALAVTVPANVIPASVTFDNSINKSYTFSGAGGIAGTGSVLKKGTGTVTLSNLNTYTGNTLVQGGMLVLDYTSVTPVAAASAINVATGAVLKAASGDADFTLSNSFAGAGTVIIDPHATASIASRQVTISGNNSNFTGTLKLSPTSGTFRVPVATTTVLGSASVDVDNGGQIFLNAANLTLPNNFTISGSGYAESAGSLGAIRAANPTTFTGTITVDGAAKIGAYSGQANIAGALTGGDLTFGGNTVASINETMVLTGNASGLNSLAINGGSTNAGTILLQVGNGTASGELGTVPITLRTDSKGGVLRFRQGNDYLLKAPVTSIGNTTFQADTLAGTSTGKGLVLTDAVNLNGGTLQVGTAAIANNEVAKLTIENGAVVNAGSLNMGEQASKQSSVDQTGGTVSIVNQMRVGHWPTETSTYNLSAGTLSVTAAAGAAFPYGTAEQNGGVYLGIDGTGVMNHSGGTLSTNWVVLDNRGNTAAGANMTGADTYNLSGTGLLQIKSSHGIISRHATADVNLGGGTIEAVSSFNLDSDRITITGNTTLKTNGNTITALASLGGTGGLTVSDAGTLRTADSAVAGFVGGSLGGNPVALGAGSTLQADRTGTDAWSGDITGGGSLVKDNTGTLTLFGANSYTGSTLVNAGVLEVSGSIAGSLVTVSSGATIAGDGSIGTSVNINGKVAPGSLGAGTLTVSGLADFNDGSTFTLDITNGVSFDKLVANSVTLDGSVNLSISLAASPVAGTTYRILDNTSAGPVGGTSGFFTWAGPQGVLTEGEHFYVDGNEFLISYVGGTGNDVVLTAIPEPGSCAALLGGLGTLLGLQRFRRRRAE